MGNLEKGVQENYLSIWWGLSAAATVGTGSALLLSAVFAEGGHRGDACMDSVDLWRISGSLSTADIYRIFGKEVVSSDSAGHHGEVEKPYYEDYREDVFLRLEGG